MQEKGEEASAQWPLVHTFSAPELGLACVTWISEPALLGISINFSSPASEDGVLARGKYVEPVSDLTVRGTRSCEKGSSPTGLGLRL